MKLTKDDYICLRRIMFDLYLTDLTDVELDLVIKTQFDITKGLKALGEYSDEIIISTPAFTVKRTSQNPLRKVKYSLK